jgi:hypothetical protein
MHTGDHQVAKELGLLELRRSWAETSADGSGRLTKHAPELEYPSLKAADIKQRFETDLKAQGFDPETTFLKTDDLTRTESKTMHPTYALTVNGEALTLPDGAALRWKPNEGLFQVGAVVIAPTNEGEEVGDNDLDGTLVRTASINPKEPIYGGERPECRTINLRLQKILTESDNARTKIQNATSKREKDEAIDELRQLREEARKLRAKRKCLKCTSKPTVSKETEILKSACN